MDFLSLAAAFVSPEMATCRTIVDFAEAAEHRRWQVINDGVMGGLSQGELFTREDRLVFAGTINTNGGGFSSIRRRVGDGLFDGATTLRVTMLGDARSYQLSLRSDVTWRGRSVAYRATLRPQDQGDDWSVATVSLSRLQPSVFGQRVRAPSFDPTRTQSIGFIIADGQDGPFDLSIRKIEVC
ncbi:MAG: CIA30 family protein [Sphingomonas sp.]|nr:CIA30 family protein [Sphingomonas sp.]